MGGNFQIENVGFGGLGEKVIGQNPADKVSEISRFFTMLTSPFRPALWKDPLAIVTLPVSLGIWAVIGAAGYGGYRLYKRSQKNKRK